MRSRACLFSLLNNSFLNIIHMWLNIFESESISCSTLCSPMDYSPPGSFVLEILQARILEWIPFSRRSSWPRDRTQASRIAGRFFTIWTTREALKSLITSNKTCCVRVFASVVSDGYLLFLKCYRINLMTTVITRNTPTRFLLQIKSQKRISPPK